MVLLRRHVGPRRCGRSNLGPFVIMRPRRISSVSPSSQAASRRMRSTRSRDTRPEVRIRSELHRMGLRFRVHARPVADLRSRADVLFGRAKVAVFLDGCFWHSCPLHGTMPKANAAFWRQKLAANRSRDAKITRRLRLAGWEVVRVWEHEQPQSAARMIARTVRARIAKSETLSGGVA